jgi:hypothetical protein
MQLAIDPPLLCVRLFGMKSEPTFNTSVLRPYHASDEPRSFGGAMLRMGAQSQVRSLPCIPSVESVNEREQKEKESE